MTLPRSWHRLALSLLGIAIIGGMWRWSLYHLYALPPTSIAAFTSITNNAFYAITVILIFLITGRLVFEWSNATQSAVNIASEVKAVVETQKKDITITKQPTRSDFYNDQ